MLICWQHFHGIRRRTTLKKFRWRTITLGSIQTHMKISDGFGQVFGKCWMASIERQKRGLPRPHILIRLIDKITPDKIDQVVSAELPDLFEDGTKNLIHGLCGAFNGNSPRMKDGQCTKRYPGDSHSETITGNGGHPKYRRGASQLS